MSFFSELKRRNVFRVGVAYAVVAWVILQFVDIIKDILTFPAWFSPMVLVVLLIGFPVALILSWAFEVTPEGVKKTAQVDKFKSVTSQTGQKINKLIIGSLLLAVVILLVDKFYLGAETPVIEKGGEAQVSIAVLPFVNMSADPGQEYFSDGITEEILNTLVRIKGLNVAARTSAFSYKGINRDLRDIGRELGVDTIVEGSVRRAGDDLRITAQLIRVSDGIHMWSGTFDRKFENVFAIQEEIAFAISDAVQVPLGLGEGNLVSNRMTDMQAYDQYLEARRLIRARGEGLSEAAVLLRQVVAKEPGFAPAWAALSNILVTIPGYFAEFDGKPINASRLNSEAEVAAIKSVVLDPGLADAHHAYANALRNRGAYAQAEDHYEIAYQIDPDSIEILEDFREFYGYVLHYDKALELAERAYALEPDSPLVLSFYADALSMSGQASKGVAIDERALEIDPNYTWAGSTLFESYLMNDEPEKALSYLAANDGYWEHYLNEVSDPPLDFELLRAHLRGEPVSLQGNAIGVGMYGFYAYYLGGDEGFLDVLEYWAYGHGSSLLYYNFPGMETIRSSARYKALVLHLGVVDFWRERGWPKYCRPVGDYDFECGAGQ